MKLTFVSLFPSLIASYFEDALLKRATEKKLFELEFINPRDFSTDKHHKVDDIVTGGGAGMLLSCQPLFDALRAIPKTPKTRTIFLMPAGKQFAQNDAKRLANADQLILVSGRYEGFDERIVEKFADEVFSIGDFVLTGGELASLVVADSVVRNIEGVLGNSSSLDEESFGGDFLEAPAFTKPTTYENITTPSILLSGHHKNIRTFKEQLSKIKTKYFRPDLYIKQKLSSK